MNRMFSRVGDTIHATIYGTLAVAAVQGTLGGLMFWWLGLPAPLLWGLAMGVLAVVPVLGAFIVWIPAALWLFMQGSTGWAIFMGLWGVLVVSMVDNVLKPMIISHGSNLPFMLVLLGVLGGAAAFGFVGIFLGPTLLAVGYRMLNEWVDSEGRDQGRRSTDA